MPPKVLNPGNAASCVKGTFDVIERLIRVWICEDIILSIFSMTSSFQNLAHFRIQDVQRNFAILSSLRASRNDHVTEKINLASPQVKLLTFP
jgi:hypothetical protein